MIYRFVVIRILTHCCRCFLFALISADSARLVTGAQLAALTDNFMSSRNEKDCHYSRCKHTLPDGDNSMVQCYYDRGLDTACRTIVHIDCAMDSRPVVMNVELGIKDAAEIHNIAEGMVDSKGEGEVKLEQECYCRVHLPLNCLRVARCIEPAHFQCACDPLKSGETDSVCSYTHCTSQFHSACMAGSVATAVDDPDSVGEGLMCIQHLPRSSLLVQRGYKPLAYWHEWNHARQVVLEIPQGIGTMFTLCTKESPIDSSMMSSMNSSKDSSMDSSMDSSSINSTKDESKDEIELSVDQAMSNGTLIRLRALIGE